MLNIEETCFFFVHCRNCTRQLSEILKELQDKTAQTEVRCYVNVRRNFVWEDTCALLGRKRFNPRATVSVKFSDDDGNAEGAVDAGGPRREFFRLLLHAANEKAAIFQGPLHRRVLFPNSAGELVINIYIYTAFCKNFEALIYISIYFQYIFSARRNV